MSQVTKSDYKVAQENPKVRQDFLNAADLEDAAESIYQVGYVPKFCVDGSRPKENKPRLWSSPMVCMYPAKAFGSFGRKFMKDKCFSKSNIFVYSSAFELPFSVFLSVLIDHEGYHARHGYQKPEVSSEINQLVLNSKRKDRLGRIIAKSIDEIPAYLHQLKHIEERKVNLDWLQTICQAYEAQYRLFMQGERKNPGKFKDLLIRSTADFEMSEEVERWLNPSIEIPA